MISFLSNAYIFIGLMFVTVVLLQSKIEPWKKLAFVLAFGLLVLIIERPNWPYWLELWVWKVMHFLGM